MVDIFKPNFSVTGIRSEDQGNTVVLMTGNCPPSGNTPTLAMLYRGQIHPEASAACYCLLPFGYTNASSIFYGPDTWFSNPNIKPGNVRAVGTYHYNTDPEGVNTHGMMYEGPLNGIGGTWTPIDVPANKVGGGTVINTIPHSTMGELIVGNYERVYTDEQGTERHEFGAFVYNIHAQEEFKYRKLRLGPYKLVTAYGIWQNGKDNKNITTYTIAGGLDDGSGINVGYLVDYDPYKPEQQETSNLKPFEYPGDSNLITHFEGITDLDKGSTSFGPKYYSLAATGDQDKDNRGAAFAVVERLLPNGIFGEATWQRVQPNDNSTASGNTVLTNHVFGVYPTGGENFQSYVVDDLPLPNVKAWS